MAFLMPIALLIQTFLSDRKRQNTIDPHTVHSSVLCLWRAVVFVCVIVFSMMYHGCEQRQLDCTSERFECWHRLDLVVSLYALVLLCLFMIPMHSYKLSIVGDLVSLSLCTVAGFWIWGEPGLSHNWYAISQSMALLGSLLFSSWLELFQEQQELKVLYVFLLAGAVVIPYVGYKCDWWKKPVVMCYTTLGLVVVWLTAVIVQRRRVYKQQTELKPSESNIVSELQRRWCIGICLSLLTAGAFVLLYVPGYPELHGFWHICSAFASAGWIVFFKTFRDREYVNLSSTGEVHMAHTDASPGHVPFVR